MNNFFDKLGIKPHEIVITKKDAANRYWVTDAQGSIIVPDNRYLYISPFRNGLARVKTGDRTMGHRIFDGTLPPSTFEYKWGIINSKGKEIVAPTYDYIQGFDRVGAASTPAVLNGANTILSLKGLSEEYDEHLKAIATRGRSIYGSYPRSHYQQFRGTYAQEEGGFSDEVINDAFDGEPEAYWNID